jgi:hypothetical protein
MLMAFVAGIGIAAACVRRDDGRSCDEIAKRGSRCVSSIAVRENTMPDQSGGLSEAFIAQQRTRLEALRRQLLGTEQGTIADERASQEEHGDEAEEFEDDAQGTRMTCALAISSVPCRRSMRAPTAFRTKAAIRFQKAG